MTQAKFLLPAIFLTLLGIGNITVGFLRAQDHEEILTELQEINPLPAAAAGSAMLRLQLTQLSEEGLRIRKGTVQQRIGYYQLVQSGGYILIGLGLVLFFLGFLKRAQGVETATAEDSLDSF